MNKTEFEQLISKGYDAWFRKCMEDGVLYIARCDENGKVLEVLEVDPSIFGYDF